MSIEFVIVLVTLVVCSTSHLILTAVLALYAKYQVRYLPLAWMMFVFTVISAVAAYGTHAIVIAEPGLMHPDMLSMLVVSSFFQSSCTLGVTMPGFLQMERMLKYAIPAFIVIIVGWILVHTLGVVTTTLTMDQLLGNVFSIDVLWRLFTLGVGFYYYINIIRLPRILAKRTRIPLYLLVYTAMMGLSGILYLYVSISYSPYTLCWWVIGFTLVDMLLVFPELESLAEHLLHATAALEAERQVTSQIKVNQQKEIQREEDFNEMNLMRYNRVQYWMQNNRQSWCSYTFNRDMLCEETGINRQLLLQCLRSQGHNNVHDYLTLYRVEELRRLIKTGALTSVQECDMAGFGSVKTARLAFQRVLGIDLDEYIADHQ